MDIKWNEAAELWNSTELLWNGEVEIIVEPVGPVPGPFFSEGTSRSTFYKKGKKLKLRVQTNDKTFELEKYIGKKLTIGISEVEYIILEAQPSIDKSVTVTEIKFMNS